MSNIVAIRKAHLILLFAWAIVSGCTAHNQRALPSELDLSGQWELALPGKYKYPVRIERAGDGLYELSSANNLVFSGTYTCHSNSFVIVVPSGKAMDLAWKIEDREHLLLVRARDTTDAKDVSRYPGARLTKLSAGEMLKKKALTKEQLIERARNYVDENATCRKLMAKMSRDNYKVGVQTSPDGLDVKFIRNELPSDGPLYIIEVRMNYDGSLVYTRP